MASDLIYLVHLQSTFSTRVSLVRLSEGSSFPRGCGLLIDECELLYMAHVVFCRDALPYTEPISSIYLSMYAPAITMLTLSALTSLLVAMHSRLHWDPGAHYYPDYCIVVSFSRYVGSAAHLPFRKTVQIHVAICKFLVPFTTYLVTVWSPVKLLYEAKHTWISPIYILSFKGKGLLWRNWIIKGNLLLWQSSLERLSFLTCGAIHFLRCLWNLIFLVYDYVLWHPMFLIYIYCIFLLISARFSCIFTVSILELWYSFFLRPLHFLSCPLEAAL